MKLADCKDLKKGSIIKLDPNNNAGLKSDRVYYITAIYLQKDYNVYRIFDINGNQGEIRNENIGEILCVDPEKINNPKDKVMNIPLPSETYPVHERPSQEYLNFMIDGVDDIEKLSKLYPYDTLRIAFLKTLIALNNAEEIIDTLLNTKKEVEIPIEPIESIMPMEVTDHRDYGLKEVYKPILYNDTSFITVVQEQMNYIKSKKASVNG